MLLKNTLRLTFSNASNIWKLLLYRFLCLLCVLGLTTVVGWPIINVLIKDNFFVNLQNSFEGMLFNLSFENLFVVIDSTFGNLASIISNHNLAIQAILCVVFVLLIISFLEEYAKMALNQNLIGYMSSLTKYGFTNSYVAGFGRSTLMALAKVITTLPINVLIWIGAYWFASALHPKIGVISIILTFLLLIILLSIKETLFCNWKPAYIIHGESVFKSLKMAFKALWKNILKVFSCYLVLVLCMLMLNIFALNFTAGVGLLFTLPLTTLLIAITGDVAYFEALGMRYYIDSEHIITPKKLEERDKFCKLVDII